MSDSSINITDSAFDTSFLGNNFDTNDLTAMSEIAPKDPRKNPR